MDTEYSELWGDRRKKKKKTGSMVEELVCILPQFAKYVVDNIARTNKRLNTHDM